MRTIKFRAWDADLKMMMPEVDISAPLQSFKWLGRVDLPIMQFTGLLDKNGKEIYEGDIVELDIENLNSEFYRSLMSHTGEVKWVQEGCEYWVDLFFPKYMKATSGTEFLVLRGDEWGDGENEIVSTSLEVIGNIYEKENS